jgi:hypothetical protein
MNFMYFRCCGKQALDLDFARKTGEKMGQLITPMFRLRSAKVVLLHLCSARFAREKALQFSDNLSRS